MTTLRTPVKFHKELPVSPWRRSKNYQRNHPYPLRVTLARVCAYPRPPAARDGTRARPIHCSAHYSL